jgi:hypothetical protein
MKALGKSSVMTSAALVVWILWGFVYGILCVWLYAGIRPRFGPGPGTAAKAGFVAWLLAGLLLRSRCATWASCRRACWSRREPGRWSNRSS